ncbi:MAG TPA: beta-ketoacyl synthase N-terminal-like domain-containing protein, partial [Gemmatimonadales bacterium]|nr:beta-ketoacyl synthase N-terminal-like domain-containing protein [Gemmatimonadales bacterium]
MTQEVWITGLGAVTAAGDGVASLAAALYRDESVAAPSGDGRWLARAADPDVGRAGRRLDRSGRLFLAAAREAWHDAGFDAAPPAAPDRVALLEGSSVGPMGEIISTERARCRAHDTSLPAPGLLVRLMMGAGGSTFAQEHGLRGMVHALSAGSVSAALAIAEGLWKIRSGQADVVICGGSEAPLDDEIVAVFEAAGVLAPRGPTLPCRPFDAERAGTMLGEGAGVLVLESAASARS